MDQTILRKQRELTDRLNRYRNEYYNHNKPSVSDEVYDRLFDELQSLEKETGVQMANSPTTTVGYPVVGKLEKATHEIPLLSLDKVKSSLDLCRFMGEHQVMFMLKLDGLTIKLTYEGGTLMEAATRGDGDVGEIVTHNTRAIGGIPAHIRYQGRLVITGEAFIRPSDFERLNTSIVDENGETYKNGRNLAAGSVRLRDAGECMGRCVTFMPFNVLVGFDDLSRKSERLKELQQLGFNPCKYLVTKRALTQEETEDGIKQLQQYAKDSDIPIDGIVITYNDIAFSKSRGRTGHHYKDGLAFKFEDELLKTTLRSIEWTPGRTGEIAPVAIFAPVEIEGCEVSRASLHNLSFIEDLELMPGNRI
ncbi:MAG: NAD-dependent DNA ligase LigA, partial [Clostridia bacterium]